LTTPGKQRSFSPMSTVNAELLDALRAAGAPEDKARAAAESVAADQVSLARVQTPLVRMHWEIGGLYALCLAILAKLYAG